MGWGQWPSTVKDGQAVGRSAGVSGVLGSGRYARGGCGTAYCNSSRVNQLVRAWDEAGVDGRRLTRNLALPGDRIVAEMGKREGAACSQTSGSEGTVPGLGPKTEPFRLG